MIAMRTDLRVCYDGNQHPGDHITPTIYIYCLSYILDITISMLLQYADDDRKNHSYWCREDSYDGHRYVRFVIIIHDTTRTRVQPQQTHNCPPNSSNIHYFSHLLCIIVSCSSWRRWIIYISDTTEVSNNSVLYVCGGPSGRHIMHHDHRINTPVPNCFNHPLDITISILL